MPRLAYRARTLSGETVEGHLRAADEREARLSLSKKGLEVLSIESATAGAARAVARKIPGAAREQTASASARGFFKPVSSSDLRMTTAQLALMLETGTPLSQSLTALSEQATSDKLAEILDEVHNAVASGSTLSEALGAHPRVFGEFYVSAVRAGETSGKLTDVFVRLEQSMAKREEVLSRVRAALVYPIILSVMATIAIVFLVTFVLPKFTIVFERSGAVLPLPTRMLIGGTDLLHTYWYLAAFLLFAPPLGLYYYLSSPRGRPLWDRLVLTLPVVGPLGRTVQTASLLRILGTLLSSGVPLVESLKVALGACTNLCFKQAVQRIASGVTQGESFARNFSRSDLFSPAVKQMVETGEKSGRMAYVMDRMADYLDELSQRQMQKLSALFEPAIIIVMGIAIGYIAVSLMLPLFRMSSVISRGS